MLRHRWERFTTRPLRLTNSGPLPVCCSLHVRQQFALQAVGQAEGKGLPAAGKFPAARPHDGGGDLPQALQRQAGKGEQLDQQV